VGRPLLDFGPVAEVARKAATCAEGGLLRHTQMIDARAASAHP
jgi:hypothetical protein